MKRRLTNFLGAMFSFLILIGILLGLLVLHPETPLPEEWNPTVPLRVSHPISPLTKWKLEAAMRSPSACVAALQATAQIAQLPDLEKSPRCHIKPRLEVRAVSGVTMAPLETRCQTALRLAMWTEHGLKPAARAHLGTELTRIRHLSSYNCRQIRTPQGSSGRMSTHATADAVDIAGFHMSDGRKLSLIKHWNSPDPTLTAFLRETRDSACDWFGTVLGPDYNSLHADHYHLQNRGWGTCR